MLRNELAQQEQTMRQYGRDDVDYESWYSDWMKLLARTHTKTELQMRLSGSAAKGRMATAAHLRAIEATTSMGGQSARRAHSRNVAAAAGDERIAIEGALEIHDLFPERAKQ